MKISPKHIGVGQYQHDINQNLLDSALTNVVEDCVNRVGVDLNTASPSLLSYISGINSGIAKNIVAYRDEHGAFKNRRQLLKVSKLGEKTYKQCAGFLRIRDGENPLDATAVHPESYDITEKMLATLGLDKDRITAGGAKEIEERIREKYPVPVKSGKKNGDRKQGVQNGAGSEKKGVRPLPNNGFAALAVLLEDDEFTGKNKKKRKPDKKERQEEQKRRQQELSLSIEKMAQDLGIGTMTLTDIVEEIRKPARDPRESMPPVVFRQDVLSFEDLKPDMELTGTVRNVVDFGAFVDIGVKTDGLVHISEISNRFIKHPMDAVSVGDTVKVRVLEVDHERHKIALTMKL